MWLQKHYGIATTPAFLDRMGNALHKPMCGDTVVSGLCGDLQLLVPLMGTEDGQFGPSRRRSRWRVAKTLLQSTPFWSPPQQ